MSPTVGYARVYKFDLRARKHSGDFLMARYSILDRLYTDQT